MMISATSPMFTTIQARIFLKEKISSSDIINILLVFAGIIFIVKPPFIFGQSEMYTQDPEAVYAIIAICLGSMFLQSSVYTILRMLKGEKNPCTKNKLIFKSKQTFVIVVKTNLGQLKTKRVSQISFHIYEN